MRRLLSRYAVPLESILQLNRVLEPAEVDKIARMVTGIAYERESKRDERTGSPGASAINPV